MNTTHKRTTGLNDLSYCKIISIIIIVMGIFLTNSIIIWPYLGTFIVDPFFWAFISMFALIGSSVTLCCKYLKKYAHLNMFLVGILALGRFILVLPCLPQPRFEIYGLNWVAGSVIFVIGLIFLTSLLSINPFPSPNKKAILITTGFYSITRNPIYLGEILWTLGWAIMFGSIIGVALVPLWWAGLLFNIMLEEEDLERKIGQPYLEYKERVQSRIIPGLPI